MCWTYEDKDVVDSSKIKLIVNNLSNILANHDYNYKELQAPIANSIAATCTIGTTAVATQEKTKGCGIEEIRISFGDRERDKTCILQISKMLNKSIDYYSNLSIFSFSSIHFNQDSQFSMNDLYDMISNFYTMCVKNNRNKNCFATISMRTSCPLSNQDMESGIIDKLYKLFFQWVNDGLIHFGFLCPIRYADFNLQAQKEKMKKYLSFEKFDQYDEKWIDKLLLRRMANEKVRDVIALLYFQKGLFRAEIGLQDIQIMNAMHV